MIASPSPTPEYRYARACREQGCPRDQAEALRRAAVVLQPQQLRASAAARWCDREDGPLEVGYGGARGGGKSHWLVAQIGADDCQRRPGLKALILRKVGKAVREGFEDLRTRVLAGLPHDYRRQDGVLVFPNGSRILLGHFKDEKDIDAYLGLEYDVIGVEEATTLTTSKYRAIRTCCRTSKPGWRPRTYSTTNPGGLGHAWYKARFIDPYRKGEETGTRFIPATVDDNRFIDSANRRILNELTGWQRAAWRFGDWDIAAGQFFTTFRREMHVRACEPHPAWRYWGAFDYGFTHFTEFFLLCEDGDGHLYAVDEHAARGWLPQRHAPAILSLLQRHGKTPGNLWKIVAGPDVFAKRGLDEGQVQTIAEAYKRLGLEFTAANDDRVNGAGEVLRRLGDAESDPPIPASLTIHPRCARLIECLPSLQHDPHRPEDVLKTDCDEDGIGGDDAYDGFRYGVMAAWKPRGRQYGVS